MNVPENLKYTNEHEWIKVEGDTAVLHTDYAQHELKKLLVEVET
jgi:glycine cleavage system H protein